MQSNDIQPSRVNRAMSDLVMAEMFLVQATIESATAIGDGINQLSKQLTSIDAENEPLSALLQRTADEALEPYTTRFKYLRSLIETNT